MKKYIVLFIVIISPIFVVAQNFSNSEKALISGKIDTLLQKYMQKSALSEMPGLKKRNEKMFKEYKGLFSNDARIFDDMNANFDQQAAKDYQAGKTKEIPYKLETKSRIDYFDGLVDEFELGFVINNKKINISYNNFEEGIIKVALERQIEGTSYKGYKLMNNDTLLLSIIVSKDKSVKINKVEAIGSHIKVLNDDDFDGVINEKDDCPKEFGKVALAGCPDKDDDGIADKSDACPDLAGPSSNDGCPGSTFSYRFVFSGSAGYQLNKNKITMSTNPDDLGYNQINKFKSSLGEIINPKYQPGFALNANIAYYIGKNRQSRNKGISVGVSVINYKAGYDLKGADYYFKSSVSDNYYTRRVKVESLSENLSFTILDIPVLFKYKGRFGKAWAWELSAGASYLSIRTKSTYNYTIDYEGVFFNKTTNPLAVSNEWYSLSQIEDLNLLDEVVNANGKLFGSNLKDINDLLNSKGYDFEYQKSLSGSNIAKARTGLAFNAGADLFYHVTAKIALKLGFAYMVAPSLKNKSSDYKMINSTKDDYQSFYDSKAKSTFNSYGANLGIIIGI